MGTVATCALCGAEGTEIRFQKPRWSVLRCSQCGLVFMHPIPPQSTLRAFYRDDYYTHVERSHGRRSVREDLKRLVARERHGVPLDHRFASWPATIRGRLAWLLRHQMRIPPPPAVGGRVLDVGCGNGEYLSWLKELGWECYGNETDDGAVAAARRRELNVFHGDLTEADYPTAFFDVVNMSSVLDHTADPVGNVTCASRILKPGGLLIAHSPNIESLQSRVFGSRWYNFIPPEHLFYFGPRTFRAIFERAGLVVERQWVRSPSNFLPHTLMYKTWARPFFLYARDRLGLTPEWSLPVRLLFWPLARLEDLVGRGEVLYVRARKPLSDANAE